MQKRQKQEGMTILEVMIAMAIFSVCAMALLNSITSQMNAVTHFQQSLFASWVADNTLTELSLEGNVTAETQIINRTEMADEIWFLELNSMRDENNDISLQRIDVRVEKETPNPSLSLYARFASEPKEDNALTQK